MLWCQKKMMQQAINRRFASKIDTFTVFLSEAVNKLISRGTKELLPIDEKEFLTVSKLIRGRAKLHDVNKVHVYK